MLVREHRWHFYFLLIFVCHYSLIVASQLRRRVNLKRWAQVCVESKLGFFSGSVKVLNRITLLEPLLIAML